MERLKTNMEDIFEQINNQANLTDEINQQITEYVRGLKEKIACNMRVANIEFCETEVSYISEDKYKYIICFTDEAGIRIKRIKNGRFSYFNLNKNFKSELLLKLLERLPSALEVLRRKIKNKKKEKQELLQKLAIITSNL